MTGNNRGSCHLTEIRTHAIQPLILHDCVIIRLKYGYEGYRQFPLPETRFISRGGAEGDKHGQWVMETAYINIQYICVCSLRSSLVEFYYDRVKI